MPTSTTFCADSGLRCLRNHKIYFSISFHDWLTLRLYTTFYTSNLNYFYIISKTREEGRREGNTRNTSGICVSLCTFRVWWVPAGILHYMSIMKWNVFLRFLPLDGKIIISVRRPARDARPVTHLNIHLIKLILSLFRSPSTDFLFRLSRD